MASWFSGEAFGKLTDLKNKVQTSVTNAASSIGDTPDLLQKLTLQSPELAAERERIENEERHKENVRDSLAEILPWETRDAEMEILVDECKEVILKLSEREETFTGPFVLAGGLPSGREYRENAGGDGNVEDDDESEIKNKAKDLEAAQLSADKLSKLQPLPALLDSFDLDTHVGLIQRLLKVDPRLVEMHSRLSSGGQRELTFWKNYFFHCAYTRYEAGLSIDEIWSSESITRMSHHTEAVAGKVPEEASEDFDMVDNVVAQTSSQSSDEEVVFDSNSSTASRESSSNAGVKQLWEPVEKNLTLPSNSVTTTPSGVSSSAPFKENAVPPPDSVTESTGGIDYELVSNSGVDEADEPLDELEAEIAAALGD